MDIRDSIRRRMKEAQKLREANKYDPSTQPNLYELGNFLRKSGYRLVDALKLDGKVELVIESVTKNHLYPEIHHDVSEGIFYVDVVKYGMLVASDLEEVMKGYTTALGVLHHLESIDLNNLELDIEDED